MEWPLDKDETIALTKEEVFLLDDTFHIYEKHMNKNWKDYAEGFRYWWKRLEVPYVDGVGNIYSPQITNPQFDTWTPPTPWYPAPIKFVNGSSISVMADKQSSDDDISITEEEFNRLIHVGS